MSDDLKAVVLLSGGQDSTTCLFWAKKQFKHLYALTINYGQRHDTEIHAAAEIAQLADCVQHALLPLDVLGHIGGSALVDKTIPLEASGGIPDKEMPEGLPTSYVPGRNIFLLATAATYAVKVGAHHIVTGVCQTDYSGYPDCRAGFIASMEDMFMQAFPTGALPMQIHTPLMKLTKAETVNMAVDLGEPCLEALSHSVTCYHGEKPGCGDCPACDLRAKGFAEAGVKDPAKAA